ncbi:undecaprenyl/decaprenyl-phosphate alpha-N-acetylglucosaminyl 1-phosphate transferase, partial [Kitasatospora sp. A2-31]|nr:undecaprenyl/decaprenyl-phosphate alpha-N-acetylglucosaminyl 1-phosphate transferase [Kitasatospora sp. A2-31]
TVVLTLAGLCLVGLVVLLPPRFRPRAPRAVQSFVPPRYRRRPAAGRAAAAAVTGSEAAAVAPASAPMAELSAKDKELLGELGKGSSAVSGRGHGSGRVR